MKNQRVFWLLLVATVLNSARAEVTPSYFLNGGELQLRPSVSVTGPITSILWKHEGDLLAEWIENNVPLTYYAEFKNRTFLDIKTGWLEIKNMDEKKDRGSYTLEINNKVHGQSYDAIPIIKVTKPSIWLTPVACDGHHDNCTLDCEGSTEGAEPVTYTWLKDADRMADKTKTLNVFRTEAKSVKTFTCRMTNPVSEEESDSIKNPFFVEETPVDPTGPVVGVIVVVAILGGLAGAYWKRDSIRAKLFPPGAANTDSAPAVKVENPPSPTEVDPLKNEEDGNTTSVPVEKV